MHVRSDGSMVCLCVSVSGSVGGSPTNATVKLDRFDAAGKLLSSTAVASFAGEPDPRDEGTFIPERPPHVVTSVGFSADGETGFVGWSRRAHPSWESGVIAVSVRDGTVIDRLELPDESTGDETSRRVVRAPSVIGATVADGLLLAREWYQWTPPASESARFSAGTEVFQARLTPDGWLELVPVQFSGDCGSVVRRGGGRPDGGIWFSCGNGASSLTVLRRIAAEGTLLPDVSISGRDGIEGDPTALSPDGSTLYAWDALSARLSRIDVASGDVTRGEGLSARLDTGPIAAFGDWLAPTVAAKTFLRGSVLVSPDGTRVYALGITEGVEGRDVTGSAGVFVFDAATLELLGAWEPTANLSSLAISVDGRFLYAAGTPGTDRRGRHRSDQQASITVFDTSEGAVRLIAGALGGTAVTFPSTTIE
jgi:hypothetical protein